MTRKKVLACLRATGGWCSGEALSRELGVSRAAVAKHVAALRATGCEIEAVTRRGYRLAAGDTYTEAAVRAGLDTGVAGQGSWHWLRETDSTNRYAVSLALQGAPSGSLVVAERQVAGRGRNGKNWFTSPGGLAFSLLWRFDNEPGESGEPDKADELDERGEGGQSALLRTDAVAPLLLRLLEAVAKAVHEETGLPLVPKKPNDLLLHGRKCCGVLVESGAEVDEVKWLVLGIGLNVNARTADFPPELRERVTSLAIEKGSRVARAPLLRALLRALDTVLHNEIGNF